MAAVGGNAAAEILKVIIKSVEGCGKSTTDILLSVIWKLLTVQSGQEAISLTSRSGKGLLAMERVPFGLVQVQLQLTRQYAGEHPSLSAAILYS